MIPRIVIIPTYNEKENIEDIIRKVISLSPVFNILIVDDNSPDGTGKIVKQLQIEFPDQLFLMERKEKNGVGTAYLDGFKWCIGKGYEFIWKHGFNIVEVPIIFTDRTNGESKISHGIIKEAIWGVFSMKLRSFFKSYNQIES
ncbi:MAG: glycosyltransferase [Bacteroidetes bacterium]|nr:glycosyltransferase [Bacteroidota bacterium]